MSARRIVATLLVLVFMLSNPASVRRAGAQPAVPEPEDLPEAQQAPSQSTDATPARVSYLNGPVSFWRPGAQDWTSATLNTPLAPGDVLYAGEGGNVEIQVGPRAFVRASSGTQIGLDNQEPDFIQFRLTGGQAALDLRQLAAGSTVELDTPSAAFTVDRAGYYHVNVDQDSTAFATYRGGAATMTLPGAPAAPIAADQQVVITGTDSPRVAIGGAPQLTAWDNWNYQRTDYLLGAASARYVSPAVYGTEALDQYGSWRTAETYGSVWVPSAVPAGWVPYSTGRWIWDPRFGWTWLDDAPWGWAPYHYGRWVFVDGYWAWAPGPVIVRPVYSPALVVFLGGVTVSVGRPLCWAPLGWGEPVIPWWGPRGFIGVASWHGWGGPRVVNNVVINRTTTVNVTNITVYKNVNVVNAVVGVPADRFGHGSVQPAQIKQAEVQQLKPVHGALQVRPVAESVMPATPSAVKPPTPIRGRAVVATRLPHDPAPTLRAQGLTSSSGAGPTPPARLVPSPKRIATPSNTRNESRPGSGMAPSAIPGTAAPGQGRPPDRKVSPAERPTPPPPGSPRTATPPPANAPGPEQRRGAAIERPTPPPPPGSPRTATPPPANLPGPEQRRGATIERPTPPPPPGSPRTATPPPANVPGPEQRRGAAIARPTPPPPFGSPRTATPPPANMPGPEQRRERPVPPPQLGAPRVAPPQHPAGPGVAGPPAPRAHPPVAPQPGPDGQPRVQPPVRGEQQHERADSPAPNERAPGK